MLFFLLVSCSNDKNTAQSRWWHSFNARYNTYFNGSQAYIDASMEKENGNKDNFTEIIPLYPVGNKNSREIGKSNYDRAIEKSQKAIKRHSIKRRPEWTKNRKKTERDIEWLSRSEYNPFLWKAWLLMGRSQFHKGAFEDAASTFAYMSRLYQTQPAIYGKARAWLAKCYIEQDWIYDAEDVITKMKRDSIDWRAAKEWDYTLADYYIHTERYEEAIPYLRKVIRHEMRRKQKAREWYLMGQLEAALGHHEKAYQAFKHVIRQSPPYELEFNARIAMTEVMASTHDKQMIKRLKRMAASDKNKDYLDQVYYAIGNIYLSKNDTLNAIAAYEKGNEKATRSGIEKGVLLLHLGDLYWAQEKFSDARRCYGEAIGLLDKDRDDYEQLSSRSKVLDELVPHTEAVHLQDSLLELSVMPEADRLAAIDRVIEALKQKEKEEREAQLDAEAEQLEQQLQQQAGRNPLPNTPTTPATPAVQGNGQWYFYNPMAVNQGKNTFQQQWGRRENKDNWQRINVTVVNTQETSEDSEEPEDSVSTEAPELADSLNQQLAQADSLQVAESSPADSLANDPHEREYYLAQIPFTDEQKAACHSIIQDGLFHAGVIFKDKLDNLTLSERHLVRLTDNYHDYEHLDEAWYHLWLLYSRKDDISQADTCLNRLKTLYPESEWTILLTDPYEEENARFGEHIEDSLYSATYEGFKQDRHDMVQANARISESRFPQGEHRDKFLFIEGLSYLNDGQGDSCISRLNEVVKRFPDSEVSSMAGMIIKGVSEGRKLHGGKFDIGDVWSRRDITLTADSTSQDTLDARRDQNFLFILAYEPDSVNENQLLYNMARYNFTNFLVRNFDIQIDEDHGLHRMLISGFLNYDEALQYARQLYADEAMNEAVKGCRSLIIGDANLPLLGTRYSYDDYQQFYEDTFVPLEVSEEQLLTIPEGVVQPDIEDMGEPESEDDSEEENEDDDDLFLPSKPQPKVQDIDFGDDFW